MNKLKEITDWELATTELAKKFVEIYYGAECIPDMYWIGKEIGGVLSINDEFWSMDNITQSLSNRCTRDELFEYWYTIIDCADQRKSAMNLEHYLLQTRSRLEN